MYIYIYIHTHVITCVCVDFIHIQYVLTPCNKHNTCTYWDIICILPSSVWLPAPGCTPNGAAQSWEPSRQPEHTDQGSLGWSKWVLKCRESAWESMKSITNISLVNKLSFSNEFSLWENDHSHSRVNLMEADMLWTTAYRTSTKEQLSRIRKGHKKESSRKPSSDLPLFWMICVAAPPSDLSLEAAEEVLIRNLTSKPLIWHATAVSEYQNACFVLMTPTDASQVKNMCQCLRSRHI